MAELRWAPPSRDDDPEWAALLAAMEVVDQRGETFELDDLADEWSSTWSHPDTNSIFVWDGPELVAFAWLSVRPGEREAHKVSCWGGVRPSHRRQGVGTQVLEWALRRARAVVPGLDPAVPTKAEVQASPDQVGLQALARGAGFEVVREFLEIARPAWTPVPDLPAPPGLDSVPWTPELDEEARLCHVDAFADHWGSEPRTPEEWAQWYTGHRAFRPDLSRLAVDPASGEVAALVLSAAYPQDWATVPVEAWINTVGTRRSWRGKGAARWLMADALRRIAAAEDGFERAILGVDAENPTGALRLYRDLDFTDDVRSVLTFNLLL